VNLFLRANPTVIDPQGNKLDGDHTLRLDHGIPLSLGTNLPRKPAESLGESQHCPRISRNKITTNCPLHIRIRRRTRRFSTVRRRLIV
jgi:hypothetical protein